MIIALVTTFRKLRDVVLILPHRFAPSATKSARKADFVFMSLDINELCKNGENMAKNILDSIFLSCIIKHKLTNCESACRKHNSWEFIYV